MEILSYELLLEMDAEYVLILERQKMWEREKAKVYEQSQKLAREQSEAIYALMEFKEAMVQNITASVMKKLDSSNNFMPTVETVKFDDYDEEYVLTPPTSPASEEAIKKEIISSTPMEKEADGELLVEIFDVDDTESDATILGENTHNVNYFDIHNVELDINFHDQYVADFGIVTFYENKSVNGTVPKNYMCLTLGDDRSRNLIYNY